jgi:hypothetical protein
MQTQSLLFDELPRARDPVLYICHKAEGIEIEQRRDDGYIDATAMCRAYNKRFNNYHQTDTFKEFAQALSVNTGIPVLELVQSAVGGSHSGTWAHPRYAIRLAISISPDFAVTVTGWVLDWMQGRQPTIHKDDIEPFVIGRLVQETHSMVSRILDTTAHIDQNTESTAVNVKELHVDLWRVIGQELPKQTKQSAPALSPPRGSYGQPIPRLVEPRTK